MLIQNNQMCTIIFLPLFNDKLFILILQYLKLCLKIMYHCYLDLVIYDLCFGMFIEFNLYVNTSIRFIFPCRVLYFMTISFILYNN